MKSEFLHAEGRDIVDGNGQKIILTGWGLGNWLVPEGYMWLSGDEKFDRFSRMNKIIEELAGTNYAEIFWHKYRENYVNKSDIMQMAQLGYNSVRIPLHYRLFMEEGSSLQWKEEGFKILDKCIQWCEEAGIYAFLDLHAAPGGQTGRNIDDSENDAPDLFLKEQNEEKCVALWVELARRYRDKKIVGGYDLLNEPIAPPLVADYDYLIPQLSKFYRRLIREIRCVDQNHMLSIEGPHWATDTSIFDCKFDDNMVLHFHRYAEEPDIRCLHKYIEVSYRLDIPLWMGETGENTNEWYAAFYPLAYSLGIGYNLWTWKKMECTNSPYSVNKPEEYEKIMDYIQKGIHPGEKKAREIFDRYLENCRIEKCKENSVVTNHVMHKVPFCMRATDFDECPGKGKSFWGTGNVNMETYRGTTGMEIVELHKSKEKRFCFDCGWDRYGLVLHKGEFVCYQAVSDKDFVLCVSVQPTDTDCVIEVGWISDEPKKVMLHEKSTAFEVEMKAGNGQIKVSAIEGKICMVSLKFDNRSPLE